NGCPSTSRSGRSPTDSAMKDRVLLLPHFARPSALPLASTSPATAEPPSPGDRAANEAPFPTPRIPMPSSSSTALAAAVHDAAGNLTAAIERLAPALTQVFAGIALNISDATAPAVVAA